MAEQIFPRNTGTQINIETRQQDASVGLPYQLVMTLSPGTIEVDGQTIVRFRATLNGVPIEGFTNIHVENTNPTVAVAPDVFALLNGVGQFAMIGLAEGTTSVSASMVISGITYASNSATITVDDRDLTENYAATGYGKIVADIEPAIAAALVPRVERLSHEEQQIKYPGDDGLKWATHFSTATVTFVPRGG